MKILEYTTKNFCQHRDRTFKFTDDDGKPISSTLFLGANGTGKSNAIKALRFGLTGKSGNFGNKIDDLSWGESKGHVVVQVGVNGTTGKMKRSVNSAAASLKIDKIHIKKASEIDTTWYPMIGVTQEMLLRTVFIGQGELETVLFDTPANRKDELFRIFGISGVEDIRRLLEDESKTWFVQEYTPEITAKEGNIRQHLIPAANTAQERITAAVAFLESVNTEVLTNLKNRYEYSLSVYNQRVTIEQRITTFTDNIKRLQQSLTDARATLVAGAEATEEMEGRAGEARLLLRSTDESMRKWNDKQSLGQQITTLQTEEKTEPAQPTRTEPTEDQKSHGKSLQQEVGVSRTFVNAFSTGSKYCPTCGETVTDVVAKLQKHKDNITAIQTQLSDIEQRTEEWRTYKSSHAVYSEWVKGYLDRINQVTTRLKSLGDVQKPETDVVALQDTISKHEANMQMVNQLTAETTKLSAQLEEQSNTLSTAIDDLKAMEQDTQVPDPREYEQACNTLNEVTRVTQQLGTDRGELATLNANIEQKRIELDALRAKQATVANTVTYLDTIEEARGVLHRDSLPALVARTYLVKLNMLIAKYMEIFNSEFSARIDDSFAVIVEDPDAPEPYDSHRLSGGQKVMLALAFRFAVNDLFAAKFGLLILDEPTAWLDNDNIKNVVKLMEMAKGVASESGIQLIVITHEKELQNVFDQVIKI